MIGPRTAADNGGAPVRSVDRFVLAGGVFVPSPFTRRTPIP